MNVLEVQNFQHNLASPLAERMQTRRHARRESTTRTRKNRSRHALYHTAAFNPKKSVHIPSHALVNKVHAKLYRKTPFHRGARMVSRDDDE